MKFAIRAVAALGCLHRSLVSGYVMETRADEYYDDEGAEVRIVGGEDAVKGAFPWHGAVRKIGHSYSYCGAALISPKWALSAAHCFEYIDVLNSN